MLFNDATEAESAGAIGKGNIVENALRLLSVCLVKGNALMSRRELGSLAAPRAPTGSREM